MYTEEQAFNILKKLVKKDLQHLIQWRHILQIQKLSRDGYLYYEIDHQKADPGIFDPDWTLGYISPREEDLLISAVRHCA